MKTYSQDLREKVAAAVAQDKQSNRRIAEIMGISESTIEKWMRRQRETGSVAAAPHAGGVARVLAPQGEFLRRAVKAEPDISLNELCVRLQAELKLQVSTSMVSRELIRLRLGRKKRVSTTASGKRSG
jgi:transposase